MWNLIYNYKPVINFSSHSPISLIRDAQYLFFFFSVNNFSLTFSPLITSNFSSFKTRGFSQSKLYSTGRDWKYDSNKSLDGWQWVGWKVWICTSFLTWHLIKPPGAPAHRNYTYYKSKYWLKTRIFMKYPHWLKIIYSQK